MGLAGERINDEVVCFCDLHNVHSWWELTASGVVDVILVNARALCGLGSREHCRISPPHFLAECHK